MCGVGAADSGRGVAWVSLPPPAGFVASTLCVMWGRQLARSDLVREGHGSCFLRRSEQRQQELDGVPSGVMSTEDTPTLRPVIATRRAQSVALAIPCYNEEESLEQSATELVDAFQQAGIDLDLVLVDNGSTDGTGAIIDRLIDRGLPVTKVHVPVNGGYGYGIRRGLDVCD